MPSISKVIAVALLASIAYSRPTIDTGNRLASRADDGYWTPDKYNDGQNYDQNSGNQNYAEGATATAVSDPNIPSADPVSNLEQQSATVSGNLRQSSAATAPPDYAAPVSEYSNPPPYPADGGKSVPPDQPLGGQKGKAGNNTYDGNGGNGGNGAYQLYEGSGDDWPAQNQWVSYETMWERNVGIMKSSCSQWKVTDTTDEEVGHIKDGIEAAASTSGVDHRYILATIMQESNGCVRVPTTKWGVRNPGLMQDHDGESTCNSNNVVDGQVLDDGKVFEPGECTEELIFGMIRDGTAGTAKGDGLQQVIANAEGQGAQGAKAVYWGARIYNSGSYTASSDLGKPSAGTSCYSSDIANRLMGWVGGHGEGCNLPNPDGGVS